MNNIQKEMIETFQCVGCTCGSSTSDGCFKEETYSLACANHSAGTFVHPGGCVNLGLPKGFNRNGPIDKSKQHSIIRLFTETPDYDKFNIPVWAYEENGYLFVRTYLPRTNVTYVDVIKDGKMDSLPVHSFNVNDFIDEID
jgi:hypothetical protein